MTGSSSGIGRAIAIGLAQAGADVHLHARSNAEALAEVQTTIFSLGRNCADHLRDLSDPAGCRRLVEELWGIGPIDIWINNAGVDVLTEPTATWSFEQKLAALWEVDVRATIELSREIGRRMQARGCGSLTNIGWDQVETGMEGDSGEMFTAIKGAVTAFTRSLAKSLAPVVRVNCIAPGWIRTKWGQQSSDYWDRRARGESLLGVWGEPADVAHAAVFLSSPAAAFITGQVMRVNGGFAGGLP